MLKLKKPETTVGGMDVGTALRFFAFYLGNGSLCNEILGDFDYRPALLEGGSMLEMVFAIWSNVLEIDENDEVINDHVAMRRAAQFIRRFIDPQYVVEPPFEGWEMELRL